MGEFERLNEHQQEIRVGLHTQLDQHVGDYLDLGYHEHLGETSEAFAARFAELREALMEVSYRMPSDLPVLAVIPGSIVSLEDQLALSGNRAFLRSSEMRPSRIRTVEPEEPYVLLDVSYGQSLRNLSAAEAQKKLLAVGRLGLRIVELLSLGIHDRAAFQDIRGLYAVETLHFMGESKAATVDMYRYGDSLKVKRDPSHINDPDWTTPSYSDVFVIG